MHADAFAHGTLRPAAAASAEGGALASLYQLIIEGEFMAALRSDPAAALLHVSDAAADAPEYMAAVAERVRTALSGERLCHYDAVAVAETSKQPKLVCMRSDMGTLPITVLWRASTSLPAVGCPDQIISRAAGV